MNLSAGALEPNRLQVAVINTMWEMKGSHRACPALWLQKYMYECLYTMHKSPIDAPCGVLLPDALFKILSRSGQQLAI